VVLSACSSYFQSLFLDHPEKHPIVILKDVRFAELQTLVEFMYKGEVNVQYCQLSALLKTAESLKVKGLAEMTNQNTTLREPEREPERLRPHSQPCKRSNSCDSPVDATLSGPSTSGATSSAAAAAASTQHAAALAASALTSASNAASSTSATTNATTCTIAPSATSLVAAAFSSSSSLSSHLASSVSSKREHASERCSPSPPKRLHGKHEQDTTLLPLDLYQRRLEQHQQQEDTKENAIVNNNNTNEKQRSTTPHTTSGTIQKHSNTSEGGGGGGSGSGASGEGNKKRDDLERDSARSFNSPDRLARHDVNRPIDETMGGEGISGGVEKIEDVEDVEYGDEEMELDDDGDNNSEDVCLNMKIRSSSLAAALVSPQLTAAQRGLDSSGHGGSGVSGTEGGVDSARSTPLTTTIPMAFDTHSQRPASRSSREGSGLDRPSSRGGLTSLPSTSASAMAGGLSPASSTAAALGLHSDTVPGPSGLGPVQSVPLSLKKEIDCSEDDNSNSRHHLQPRSASASGVLGGELDYRTPHESVSYAKTFVYFFLFLTTHYFC
ncbi:Protein bric-a-brac 2, partial [Lucilia cuprina]